MVQILLVGDDLVALRARRAAIAESASVGPAHAFRFDLSDPTIHARIEDAVSTPSMFAEPRYVEICGLETLDATSAAWLRTTLGYAPTQDTVVVWGTRMPAAAKAALAGMSTESFPLPTTSSLRHIENIAGRLGVTVSRDLATYLDQRCGHDLARVSSTLYSLSVTGVLTPTPEQAARFLLDVPFAPGTPWGVADALAVNDLRTALALADGCEPVAVIAYLGTRLTQLGRIVETPLTTPAQVAAAFGLSSTAVAARLLAHAERLGPHGVASSWTLLSSSDVAVKRATRPHVVLDTILVKLGRLWARPAAGAPHPPRAGGR